MLLKMCWTDNFCLVIKKLHAITVLAKFENSLIEVSELFVSLKKKKNTNDSEASVRSFVK